MYSIFQYSTGICVVCSDSDPHHYFTCTAKHLHVIRMYNITIVIIYKGQVSLQKTLDTYSIIQLV